MAKRFRSRRGPAPQKRELIWVTTVLNGSTVGVGVTTTPNPIVVPGDWERAGVGFEKGCTLAAIRGWLSFQPLATSTGTFGSVFGVIAKQEADETVPGANWNIATPYNDEDVLWTGGATYSIGAFPAAAATPFGLVIDRGEPLEVKTKRKLNSDDVIELYVTTSTASTDWCVTGVIRCLLQLP